MKFRRRCFFAWVAHVQRMKYLRFEIYKFQKKCDKRRQQKTLERLG